MKEMFGWRDPNTNSTELRYREVQDNLFAWTVDSCVDVISLTILLSRLSFFFMFEDLFLFGDEIALARAC
jgi:hypothetical protein